ncbi:MAG TPA: hypothetical protein VMU29_12060 [Smithella sp.]|nr:hypothetical protein [Smithella sp.]
MKIIVTTSDNYRHIPQIFWNLFNIYWPDQQVELVGYQKPFGVMPDNFTFVSLEPGPHHGSPKSFGTDLRKYFRTQPERFIWCMEDCFLKARVVDKHLNFAKFMSSIEHVGRIGLSADSHRQYTIPFLVGEYGNQTFATPPKSEYRLSTQIAIWHRSYLLTYLKEGMTPWEFECQEKVIDKWHNLCLSYPPIEMNEGVRKRDLNDFNFDGIEQGVIDEIKSKMVYE